MSNYKNVDPFDHSQTYKRANDGHVGDGGVGGMDLQRMLPRQMSTGTTRGTQAVGVLGSLIDGSNNRIVMSGNDGSSIGIGAIPGTNNAEVGLFALDTDGSLLWKVVNGTLYFYDKDTGVNYMIIGVLPDLTTGWAVAAPGNNVADAFS